MSQLRFAVIAVYSPLHDEWRFAISWALPFGMSGAVLHFNRVPAFLVAFCRRWFAIPCQHFYEDFRIVEVSGAEGSAFRWFGRAMALLGWQFDHEKDQAPTSLLPMLGNIEDYSECARTDCLCIRATHQRLNDLKAFVGGLIKR